MKTLKDIETSDYDGQYDEVDLREAAREWIEYIDEGQSEIINEILHENGQMQIRDLVTMGECLKIFITHFFNLDDDGK